jgi:hypothetical protein
MLAAHGRADELVAQITASCRVVTLQTAHEELALLGRHFVVDELGDLLVEVLAHDPGLHQ